MYVHVHVFISGSYCISLIRLAHCLGSQFSFVASHYVMQIPGYSLVDLPAPPHYQHHLTTSTTSLPAPPHYQHHLTTSTTSLPAPPHYALVDLCTSIARVINAPYTVVLPSIPTSLQTGASRWTRSSTTPLKRRCTQRVARR